MSTKKLFIFKHFDNPKPWNKALQPDTNVAEVLQLIREHFAIPEGTEIKITQNNIEINIAKTFQEQGFNGGKFDISSLTQHTVDTEESKTILVMFEDQDLVDLLEVLSTRFKDIKIKLCAQENKDPESYVVTIDDEKIDESLKIGDIDNIEESVIILKKITSDIKENPLVDQTRDFRIKIKASGQVIEKKFKFYPDSSIISLKKQIEEELKVEHTDQIWFVEGSNEELDDYEIISRGLKGDLDRTVLIEDRRRPKVKPVINEVKLLRFIYKNNKPIKKQFSINEKVLKIADSIKKAFSIPSDTEILLKYADTFLDSTKCLGELFINLEDDIIVLTQEEIANSVVISFLYDDESKVHKTSVNKTHSIYDIKNKLCSILELEASYLYSLSIDNQILDNFESLNDIANFDESTIFEVQSAIKSYLIKEEEHQRTERVITVSSKGSVAELKTHLRTEGFVKAKTFGLFTNSIGEEDGELDDKLQIFEVYMEDQECLKSYLTSRKDKKAPRFYVKTSTTLSIDYQGTKESFMLDPSVNFEDFKKLIQERFLLGAHPIKLYDGASEMRELELSSILSRFIDKDLICKKTKGVNILFEDQNIMAFDLLLNPTDTLDNIVDQVARRLDVSCEIIRLFVNDKLQEGIMKTLEESFPDLNQVEIVVKFAQELIVSHAGVQYQIPYKSSSTLEDIQKALEEKGFKSARNFSYFFEKKVLTSKIPLNLYGIKPGNHNLDILSKTSVLVLLPDREEKVICDEKLSSIKNLKEKLAIMTEVEVSSQVLILIKDEQWERKLDDDNERLEELAVENLKILFKRSKKYEVVHGLKNKILMSEGLARSTVKEQKQLLALRTKFPVDHQIWILGRIEDPKILHDDTLIEDYNLQAHLDDPIKVFRMLDLNICLDERSLLLSNIPSYATVSSQKQKISKELAILPIDQLWFYNTQELKDRATLEECLPVEEKMREDSKILKSYAIDLTVQNDLEYFGFTEKSLINESLFRDFFRESKQEFETIITNTSFSDKNDSIKFRNRILGVFFGSLKKHSLWEDLIQEIRKYAFDLEGVNLWKNKEKLRGNQSKFNTQFLLYYFLNCDSYDLNIEILKVIKMHYPIPLMIKSWNNRFNVESPKIINEIYWIMQKGFVISSIGFGGAEKKVCGKTELNNKLFFSNFAEDSFRNHICKECPEILFDIYKNEKHPVDLVDIPSQVESTVANKIIRNSNLLIIHSLGSVEDTHKYIELLAVKTPIVIIYRDVPDSFAKIQIFKKNLFEKLEAAKASQIVEFNVENLCEDDRSNEIAFISSRLHEFILENFAKTKDEDLWKFSNFFEHSNTKFDLLLQKIQGNSSQLIQAIPVFSMLRSLDTSEMSEEKKDQEKSSLLNKGCLVPEIQELSQFLIEAGHNKDKTKLFLGKLQGHLRMVKSQKTKDYYRLYNFKSDFSKRKLEREEETLNQFFDYWNALKIKDEHYKNVMIERKSTKEQIYERIGDCIEIFEQKVIPSIFSIELFWRELIYFTSLMKEDLIQQKPEQNAQMNIFDFLVRMRRENVIRGSPFELIDGDLLYMPKDFYKNVFKGLKDRIIVVSILGPQSSGKSTLLNFLFGCDFTTSSGRCTKGIYGTYFKVSNFNACDGILVLDTEGLFGLLNKSEAKNRDKFDTKLVLFCLAISDFVVINFKGDIDKTLTDVLMVCRDSLKKLQQGNNQIPEMFLALNQNTQTNIENHLQDIDRMADLGFCEDNVVVLPLAFETRTKEFSNVKNSIEPITKKIPKREFSDACRSLADKIFDKIKLNLDNKPQKTLEEVMDKMSHTWELLNRFPNLLKHATLKDQALEQEMKEWILMKIDEILKLELNKDILKWKDKNSVQKECERQFYISFDSLFQKIKDEFKILFESKTSPSMFDELEKILYSHANRVKTELLAELNNIIHLNKVKIYDIEGSENIRQAIQEVKKNPSMCDQQKIQKFEQVWMKMEKKLSETLQREKESKDFFQIIFDNYQANLTTLTGGLPNSRLTIAVDLTLEHCQSFLIDKIQEYYSLEYAFEYTKDPPAFVLQGGKGDVKFKYFDIRGCFEATEFEETISIPKDRFYKILDIPKMKKEFTVNNEFNSDKGLDDILWITANELLDIGVDVNIQLLRQQLDYNNRTWWQNAKNFFNFTSKPFVQINPETCFAFSKIIEDKGERSYDFIIPHLIRGKYIELTSRQITSKMFILYILKNGIDWRKIEKIIETGLFNIQNFEFKKLSERLKKDLKQLNLKFKYNCSDEILFNLCLGVDDGHLDFDAMLCENSPNLPSLKGQNIYDQKFSYIRIDLLKENLYALTNNYKDINKYFRVAKFERGALSVKKEFEHISWLSSYVKKDSLKLLCNSTVIKPLSDFVFNQFQMKALIKDILRSCIENIKAEENWNTPYLYQKITRETNNLIGEANNDLQQVSYRLNYNLAGHIHLSVVYLIWKYYEAKYWIRAIEPLTTMQERKEKEKRYFLAMTSSDQVQINSFEAEKAKQIIKRYISEEIVEKNKNDMIKLVEDKFRQNVIRKKVQEEIDFKYFSRSSAASSDDLLLYLSDPYTVLKDAYDNITKDYSQDIDTKVQKEKRDMILLINSFLQRIAYIKALLKFDEHSCYTENVFHFINFGDYKGSEVLFSLHEDRLSQFHFEYVTALLNGNTAIYEKEFSLPEGAVVAINQDYYIPTKAIQESELLKVLEFLEEQPIRVTNTILFINYLDEQLTDLRGNIDDMYELQGYIKSFKEKINVFICDQKCPCCDRLCGEDDPVHKYHQCLYGHQMRAIGGTKLSNNDASVARCEDVQDTDIMQFNGQEITWMQFKIYMKSRSNNPWIYDDTIKNKDNATRDKFTIAWTLIGERLCQEKYKDIDMKYVAYNQATVDVQKKKYSPKHYIFMIDSSSIYITYTLLIL